MQHLNIITAALAALIITNAHAADAPKKEKRKASGCYDTPTRDLACVRLGNSLVIEKDGNVVAPFVVQAPNGTHIVSGHFLEVRCNGKTPVTMALRDGNGSRYVSGGPMEIMRAPEHTKGLVHLLCEEAELTKAEQAAKAKK